ncbi:MAG TPA: spore protease YyaC [Bacillota bacterium]|nr:spore protease YyaC [Bacillota bacterium]
MLAGGRARDTLDRVRVHCGDPAAPAILACRLRGLLGELGYPDRPVLAICVGSDRSTGDSLGPIAGSRLAELALPGLTIRGTLEEPVHATNLEQVLTATALHYPVHVQVAVDACLGDPEAVGTIGLGRGPLRPGSGVNKHLPEVGDVSLTGVVNIGGFMEYFVLQNTRLSLVFRMAQVIGEAFRLMVTQPAAVSRDRLWSDGALASPTAAARIRSTGG